MADPATGGYLAASALADVGVDTVFTLPGGHIFSFLGATPRAGLRVIQTRHEEAAVLAAEGYALAGGGLGVAAVTAGPGFTNALPGIAEAQQAGVPLVVLSGRTGLDQRGRGAVQDMEQLHIVRGLAKWAAECLSTARIPEYVAEAVHRATSGSPGVAYLEVPQDVLDGTAVPVPSPWPSGHETPARPVPTATDVEALVAMLSGADRPVALAGSGAFFSGAGAALEAFIERTGIPLVTTSAARGLVGDDHPLCVGSLVHGGVALASADVALVLGSQFNANLLYGGPPLFPPDQEIAQVDLDPGNLGGSRRPALVLTGDVAATAEAVTAAWPGEPDRWASWVKDADAAAGASRAAWSQDADTAADGIHPGLLAREVAAFAADRGATFVADGGDSSIWGLAMGRARRPGSMLYIGSALGTLGIGVPFALGARAAHPDTPAVVFTGDGAFGLTAMELDTAARYGLEMLVVVVDNGGWGDVSHGAGRDAGSGPRPDAASHMRYEVLADAVGGHGTAITRSEEIGPALEQAFAAVEGGSVAVIDARCDPRAKSSFMRGMGGLQLM